MDAGFSFRARALALAIVVAVPVWGAAQTAGSASSQVSGGAKIPSAGLDPKAGDSILFFADSSAFRRLDPASGQIASTTATASAFAKSWFQVIQVRGDGSLDVYFPPERWYEWNLLSGVLPGFSPSIVGAKADAKGAADKDAFVNSRYVYNISSAALAALPTARLSWTYGTQLVPFKFHPAGHALDTSTAVLGYFGKQGFVAGANMALVAAGGLSIVKPASSTGTSGTLSALTVATGVTFGLGPVSNNFRGALLFGCDWAGKSSTYPYEGRPWFALSLGL